MGNTFIYQTLPCKNENGKFINTWLKLKISFVNFVTMLYNEAYLSMKAYFGRATIEQNRIYKNYSMRLPWQSSG